MSSNYSVATIDSTGLAKSTEIGSTNITASLNNIVSPVATLTVTDDKLVLISVTPMSVNFETGNISNKIVTISNIGKNNLTISEVGLSGYDSNNFTIQYDSASGQTLTPGENRNICLAFIPTSTGKKTAILSISSNDPIFPIVNVSLSGITSITDEDEIDTTLPIIISISPSNGEKNVPVNSSIIVTFSEPMDELSINNSTFIVNGIIGSITYQGTQAIFTPSSNLVKNMTYTVTITTGVKDLSGNAIKQNYLWSFDTILDEIFNAENQNKSDVIAKKKCFITVITHNFNMDKYIRILTQFKDKYLISNESNENIIVNLYYKMSPYISK